MNNLAANLKILIDRVKITESELARKTGIGQSVIHRLISGETKNPKMQTLKPIAEFFSVAIEDLLNQQCPSTDNVRNVKAKAIPLLSLEKIVDWLDKKHDSADSFFVTTDLYEFSDSCYAVQLQDSTLAPRFAEGTYFMVDPNQAAKNRDFILFSKSDHPLASIRQLFLDNDEKYLKAINPDFRTIQMNDEYKFLGTIIQVIIGYKDIG